jgi:hypothetical protein
VPAVSQEAFVSRIAAAVFVGRCKYSTRYPLLRPWKGDHYERVVARLYAVDVARKLPGLFREESVKL